MGFWKFLKGFLSDHECVSWICERAWLYMAHMVQKSFLDCMKHRKQRLIDHVPP